MTKARRTYLAIALLLGLGCAGQKKHLAIVNGEPLTGEHLKQEFSRRHASLEKYMTGDEGMVRKYVEVVVERRLFLQEAYRIGLDQDSDIRAQTADYERSKAAERLLDVEVKQKSTATGEELRAAYEKVGPVFMVQEIVTDTPQEAEAAAAELKKGGEFEALARARSVAPSAKFGGRLAPFTWGQEDETSEAILEALAPGQTSEPFEVEGRWRIVRLEQRDETGTKTEFEKAAEVLKPIVERRKTAALYRKVKTDLWTKYGARVLVPDPDLEALKAAAEGQDKTVVASWTGGELTMSAFASTLNLDRLAPVPVAQRRPQVRKLVEQLVTEHLAGEEGVARGLTADPVVAEPVRRRREEFMESRLFKDYVFKDLSVTEEEIAAHYDQNRDRYKDAERRKVAQIVVKDLALAEAAVAKMKGGASFDEVRIETRKQAGGAALGGDVGWLDKDKLPKGFEAVFELAKGESTDIIKSPVAYHVVRVIEIVPERQKSLDEVRSKVREEVLFKKQTERRHEWAAKLKKDARIRISKAGIRQYVKDNPPAVIEVPAAPSSHDVPKAMPGSGGHGTGHMGGGHGAPAHGAPPAGETSPTPAAPAGAQPSASPPPVGAPVPGGGTPAS